jgi:hypothetical protein
MILRFVASGKDLSVSNAAVENLHKSDKQAS